MKTTTLPPPLDDEDDEIAVFGELEIATKLSFWNYVSSFIAVQVKLTELEDDKIPTEDTKNATLAAVKEGQVSPLIKQEPRGFGFVRYLDPYDAAEAKYQMDGRILLRRELIVVFAEENRKKPSEMRARECFRGSSYDRRGSSARYSRSPSHGRSYYCSPSYYSPSPRRDRYSRFCIRFLP